MLCNRLNTYGTGAVYHASHLASRACVPRVDNIFYSHLERCIRFGSKITLLLYLCIFESLLCLLLLSPRLIFICSSFLLHVFMPINLKKNHNQLSIFINNCKYFFKFVPFLGGGGFYYEKN